jgi:hypothetical protein
MTAVLRKDERSQLMPQQQTAKIDFLMCAISVVVVLVGSGFIAERMGLLWYVLESFM